MRIHIDMDDHLVADVDAVAGQRGRSQFVREAVVAALDQRKRAALIRSARGSVIEHGHDWDADPVRWVRRQRRDDRRRVG
ncbi:MAG: hypothetical protein H0U41_10205 [Actinobacteria bacterium]|nr:hypothetical protein [Actinomycetota bacterium]